MAIVELRVDLDCDGCAEKVKKAIEKLDGVHEVDTNMNLQKVTVTGWAEQKKILRAVRKTGKRAEPWLMPYNMKVHDFNHYYQQQRNFKYTSNPSKHHRLLDGHVVHQHDYDPYIMYAGDSDANRAMAMFSDDNPSSCSIM